MSNKVANTLLSLATIIALGGGLLSCIYYYKTINISAEEDESSSLTVEPASSSEINGSTDSPISVDKWRITSAKGTSPLNLTLTSGVLYGSVDDATYTGKGVASFDIDDFLVSNGAVSIDYSSGQKANENDEGYLSANDWTNFNNKQDTLSFNDNDFTIALNSISIDYSNGQTASSILKGFLSSADWTTFNSKQGALTFGDLTVGSNKLALSGVGTNALIGAGLSLDVDESNITHNNLAGLTTGDPHTQYTYLAGRSGGQILYGGTDAGDSLILQGTSNATKTASAVILQPNGGNVGIATSNPTNLFEIKSNISIESAPLGNELVDATGWTSTDWTGDYNNGFTHTIGNTTPLSRTMSNTGTNYYQISFTVDIALGSNKLTVSIGNSATYDLYNGSAAGSTYTAGIKSVSNGDLVFTPATDFNGKISNISVKQITGVYNPTIAMLNSANSNNLEIRSSTNNLNNLFFGVDVGQRNTTGTRNVGYGDSALSDNTSGFWNSAVGYNALQSNTTGSRNIALGYNSLLNNISGHRNIGIGSFSLPLNTTGNYNVGIGSDALFVNTTGSQNIAIGHGALNNNTTGSSNVSVGFGSGGTTSSSNNVFIGYYAGRYETGSNTLIIDSLSRGSENTGRTQALLYGVTSAASGNQKLSLGGGGNVGIGTITPGALLDVYNSTTTAGDQTIAYFRRQRTTGGDVADGLYIKSDGLGATGTVKLIATGANTQNLGIGQTGSELYIQRATFNIGISTTTPNFRFDVSGGGIRIEGTNRLYFGGTEAGDTAGNIYHDGTDFVISDTIKPTGYLSSDGTAGATTTVTVKGSDGNNCDLTYKNGLLTASTCP